MSNPYSFDPTGQLAANRINNEQQIITAPNHRNHHFVVPTFAPYFADNVTITYRDLSNNTRPLVEGIDYHHAFQFIGASRACAKPIYGGISFLNLQLTGVVTLSYNTVGGDWTIDTQQIEEILSDTLRNPRVTTWEQVVNVPHLFPPVDHEWYLQDLVGMKEVKDKIEEIALTIANKPPTNPLEGIDLYPNKNQLGLGNVDNFKTASDAEAVAGTLNSRFMTPRGVKLAIENMLAMINNGIATLTNLASKTGSKLVGTLTGQKLNEAVLFVNNIAALRALDIPVPDAGKTVFMDVLGSTTNGDGKTSRYYWDSTSNLAHNNITVISPNSNPATGRWINISKDSYAIQTFVATANQPNVTLSRTLLFGTVPTITLNRVTDLVHKKDFEIDQNTLIFLFPLRANDRVCIQYQVKQIDANFSNDLFYYSFTVSNATAPILLDRTPIHPEALTFTLNDVIKLIYGLDFTLNGNILTVTYPLAIGDKIRIRNGNKYEEIEYQVINNVSNVTNINGVTLQEVSNLIQNNLTVFKSAHLDNALDVFSDDMNRLIAQQKIENSLMSRISAWQSEQNAEIFRGMGQSGVFLTRSYTLHGRDPRRRNFTEQFNPVNIHNHPNYFGMPGTAECSLIVNGYYVRTRHMDYLLKKTGTMGSAFLSTEWINAPAVPSSVTNAGSVANQVAAMQTLFNQYNAGQFPAGFAWTLSYFEFWFEPLTEEFTDTFDSFRHQQAVNSIDAAFRELMRYNAGGYKNRLENLAFEAPVVKWVVNGNPVTARLRYRVVAADLTSLGDLRPFINAHEDLGYQGYSPSRRFWIPEGINAPGKLDEIMQLIPGMDGYGASAVERYIESGQTAEIKQYNSTTIAINSAYYNRFAALATTDAAGRNNFKRGFNDPYLFVATNTRNQVFSMPLDGFNYRFSYAIPFELVLRTPLENWNPYAIPERLRSAITGTGSEANPYNGFSIEQNNYKIPAEFFASNPTFTDPADTGSTAAWVLDGSGTKRLCRASGIYITLPGMTGIPTFRIRYPIYPSYHEGSFAFQQVRGLQDLLLPRSGTIAPNFAPTRVGQKYINTATKKEYTAFGLTTADWHVTNSVMIDSNNDYEFKIN